MDSQDKELLDFLCIDDISIENIEKNTFDKRSFVKDNYDDYESYEDKNQFIKNCIFIDSFLLKYYDNRIPMDIFKQCITKNNLSYIQYNKDGEVMEYNTLLYKIIDRFSGNINHIKYVLEKTKEYNIYDIHYICNPFCVECLDDPEIVKMLIEYNKELLTTTCYVNKGGDNTQIYELFTAYRLIHEDDEDFYNNNENIRQLIIDNIDEDEL